MQRDGFRYAVHGEIAENVAALRPRSRDAAAFECDLGKFRRVEKLRAAQMIVALLDPSIDAADVNPRRDRRFLGMLAVDVDFTAKFRKPAVSCSEELVDFESDRGVRLVEFVRFIRQRSRTQRGWKNQAHDQTCSHLHIKFPFAILVSCLRYAPTL